MHPRWSLVLGYAALLCTAQGCVSTLSLRQSFQDAVDANGKTSDAVSRLAVACESSQHTPEGMAECRSARDSARAGLRVQLDALRQVTR